jgi:phage tail sheath protein FI
MPTNFKQRGTPGVSVTELNALPPSIVGIETAVPAFIGYTETAINGAPVHLEPIRVNSLAEYEAIFGKRFAPLYDIVVGTVDDHDVAAQRWDAPSGRYVLTYYSIVRSSAGAPQGGASRPASFNLYDSLRLFYANGGGACYVVSVGDYEAPVDPAKLQQGLGAIARQAGPTMLVVPDAVLLAPTGVRNGLPVSADFDMVVRAMLAQCGSLQDRVAILDVYAADKLEQGAGFDAALTAVIENFQQSVGDAFLSFGMAYFPPLVASLVQPRDIHYTSFDLTTQLATLQAILTDQAAYQYPDPASPGPVSNKSADFLRVKGLIEQIPTTTDTTTPAGLAAIAALDQSLDDALPLLQQMETVIANDADVLPPSGAMAGIYAQNDQTRGVWNAPANVVVNSVVQPSVSLNDSQQGPLNVPLNGKAIDVIRNFVGRGPVVWGARTLDGNSSDWRYIQVRRTIIYIEQSIKTALNQFVFAPNDGNTWVAVVAMVSNFLQGVWAQGGLMGDKASDAFTVQCGLGSTMTGLDILEGYMIVQVTLQMIRPAEFIELTFKQKMEGVA